MATEDGTSSRETSPDPIVLPSSPLSGRKVRSTRKKAVTPRKSRLSQQQTRATPSKEIVLNTPQLGIANDGSPWRIKVTVQAEQRDSPGKMITKTTSIPLLDSPSQRRRSASPVKRRKATPKKNRGRKRKGAPIEGKRTAPPLRAGHSVEAPEQESEPEPEQEPEEPQDGEVLDSESHTPPNHRRASGRLTRLNAQWSDGTGRTKRLSRAREELDEALQDAVGDGHGDLTLSRAEDFTMVSLESLHTTKEASFLHNSQLARSHLSTVREGQGEKSALSVSYLPSSPPKGQTIPQYPDLSTVKAQTTILSPWQPSMNRLTAQATLQSPFEPTSSAKKKKSGLRQSIDAMSWKPALPAEMKSSSSKLSRLQPVLQTPLDQSANVSSETRRQWQLEREAVSQQIQQASPENVVEIEDDARMSNAESYDEDDVGDDADVWQTEASREIEPQDTRHTDLQRDQLVDSQRSERVEDLFAHIPLKPARPKIPRTWRRSSGMDFSYVDSPGHLPIAEPTNDRRHSTDGSGVLTPPSTDEGEEEEGIEETAGTADLQGEANDQLQSEFTQPETEGTRYQEDDQDELMLEDEDAEDELQQTTHDEYESEKHERGSGRHTNSNRDEEYVPSRNDSKSPISEAESPDEADKAIARSINNMPQGATNKEKPRKRPPRRPTTDLTELLGLASSPAKPTPQEFRVSALQSGSSSAQKRSSPLSSRHENKIRKDSPSGGTAKQRTLEVSGHSKLSNGTKVSGSVSQVSDEDELAMPLQLERPAAPAHAIFLSPPKLTHDPITGQLLAQPKRRGRRRKVGDEGQTESTVTDSFASKESEPAPRTESQMDVSMDDSFASKASDQRQLLQESAVKKKPPPAITNWSRELQSSAIKRKQNYLQRRAQEAASSGDLDRPSTGVGHRDYAAPQRGSVQDVLHEQDEYTYEDESTLQPDHTRSYEENLNLDSPTKIQVNFNDTLSFSNDVNQTTSSWLAEARRRPPLFNT
ncbi:uncharacterized protein SEPMUDRAFT_63274, partial [Sphaerulina musiva SO2202]